MALVPRDFTPMGERYGFNEKGEKIIEPSRRKDGSVRKPIKVRQDYVPTEEQGPFQTKGLEFRRAVHSSQAAPPGATLASPQVSSSASRSQKCSAPPGSVAVPSAATPKPRTKKKKTPKKTDRIDETETNDTGIGNAGKQQPLGGEIVCGNGKEVCCVDEEDNTAITLDEALRIERKKLREVNNLLKKQRLGVELTEEEKQKIERKEELSNTITELKTLVDEAQLAATAAD